MNAIKIHLTNAEYMAMPNDGKRYELHEGELVEMPSAIFIHSLIVGLFVEVFRAYNRAQGKIGYVTPDNQDFVLDEGAIFKPDVSFVLSWRLKEKEIPSYLDFAPDVVVEVLSPSNSATEMSYKINTYIRHGSRLIWIVDPKQKIVTIYQPKEGGGMIVDVLTIEDTLTGENVLPGFRLSVREIFDEMNAIES